MGGDAGWQAAADIAAAFYGHTLGVMDQELVMYGVWRYRRFPSESGPELRSERRCWAGEMEERHGLVAVDDGHTLNLMKSQS
jgi:hypothetical protein